jgi:hypothetical protein
VCTGHSRPHPQITSGCAAHPHRNCSVCRIIAFGTFLELWEIRRRIFKNSCICAYNVIVLLDCLPSVHHTLIELQQEFVIATGRSLHLQNNDGLGNKSQSRLTSIPVSIQRGLSICVHELAYRVLTYLWMFDTVLGTNKGAAFLWVLGSIPCML